MNHLHVGQTIHWLRIVGDASPNRWGQPRIEAVCIFPTGSTADSICGRTVIARESDILRPDRPTRSCGCYSRWTTAERDREHREKKHYRFRNLAGKTRGRLTAIKCVSFDKNWRHAEWECLCVCGNICVVLRGQFLEGSSCGCLKIEVDVQRGKDSRSHGHCTDGKLSPTYVEWALLVDRQNVCNRWRGRGGFKLFLADVGPRPADSRLIRIDRHKTWKPENVRWVQKIE